jgi:Ser/Thr protein kinase RdoA (MazF antagonist)
VAIREPSLVVDPADIAAHWGIELSAAFEPLATIRNLVFRSGDYVVREACATVENVAWEHELLTFIAGDVPEVVPPLPARDGSTFLVRDGVVVSVQPFVEAEPAKRNDSAVIAAIPRLLARIHLACAQWPETRPRPGRPALRDQNWVVNETWDWNALERTPLLEREYDFALAWLASPPSLTESAIHADFHSDNLLASGGRIAAVLDWELARFDWPAFDLAAAVTVVSLQRDGTIDHKTADKTVRAYIDAGGHDESYALEPLMRIFLLLVALHGRTRKVQPGVSWHPEFQEMIETALASFG